MPEKLDVVRNVFVNENVSEKFYFEELPTKTLLVLYFDIVILSKNLFWRNRF
jgi:hypothetical protein